MRRLSPSPGVFGRIGKFAPVIQDKIEECGQRWSSNLLGYVQLVIIAFAYHLNRALLLPF
jgi:hypothetical protein